LEKKEKMKKDTLVTTSFDEPQSFSFGGLNHNPFPMAPDDSDFYLSEHTETVIDKIIDAVLSKKGFMLLTGEIGLGKTTLTRRIITMLEKSNVKTSLILQSFYQEKDLLVAINRDFGIDNDDLTITTQMELLNEFLLERNQDGENCAVIIDDAQNLTFESLELIRMVSNLEADGQKLVQILLVGQTELLEKMESHELRQLKSRVTIWEKPFPLNPSETQRYVQFKLTQAGDTGRIQIEKNAFAKLFKLSQGNLRRVNIIMDRAMNTAFKDGSLSIKKKYVQDVFPDSQLQLKKSSNPYISIFIVCLLILLVGWGVGGFFFYRLKIKPLASPTPNLKSEDIAATKPFEKKTMPSRIPSAVYLNKPIDLKDKKKSIKQPLQYGELDVLTVSNFLRAYGLSSFTSEFIHSFGNGSLNEFKTKVYDTTGYELVQLFTIPDKIKNRFDVLSIFQKGNNRSTFFLFWKPKFKITRFDNGFKSAEIRALQRILKKINLYNYFIDGKVGEILIEGITKFQKNNQLEVTGFPDSGTLFLLNHFSGQGG